MRRLLCLIVLLALPGLAGAQNFIRYYPSGGLALTGGTLTGSVASIAEIDSAVGFGVSIATPPASQGMTWTGSGTILRGSPIYLQGVGGAASYIVLGSATMLSEDAANTSAQKNANADQFSRLYGANGGYWERGVNSELLTIAAAATTDTTGNLLPANAIIEAVVVRVTTIIPTAATFTVGDATTAARFATGVSVAADTTAVGLLHRNPDVAAAAGPVQTTAAKIRITPNAQPAAATGVVRIEVFFSRFVAPTS